jgi:molybdopterin-synthase adenylyltransferase
VAVVGVGAIGSILAQVLVQLGVRHLTLIDPDEVDTLNLSTQGFYEREIGKLKVAAVADRIAAIDSRAKVSTWALRCEDLNHGPEGIPDGAVVSACVDSMKTRRRIFRDFRQGDSPLFLDGRMAAESLRVFCIDRSPEAMRLYDQSFFPEHMAHHEACTARSTIYCACLAAAILCAQFKRWAMGQDPEPHIQFDILAMDCFR